MTKNLFCSLMFLCGILFSCKVYDKEDLNNLFEGIKSQTKKSNEYVYLNVWNTKCVPCVHEMPQIDSLAFIYKNKVDFVFITEQNDLKVSKFLHDKNIQLNNCVFINDYEDFVKGFCDKEQIQLVYPLHIILNKNFEVLHTHSGAITGDVFDPVLVTALKKLD